MKRLQVEGIAPSMPGWVVETPATEATARFPPWTSDGAMPCTGCADVS